MWLHNITSTRAGRPATVLMPDGDPERGTRRFTGFHVQAPAQRSQRQTRNTPAPERHRSRICTPYTTHLRGDDSGRHRHQTSELRTVGWIRKERSGAAAMRSQSRSCRDARSTPCRNTIRRRGSRHRCRQVRGRHRCCSRPRWRRFWLHPVLGETDQRHFSCRPEQFEIIGQSRVVGNAPGRALLPSRVVSQLVVFVECYLQGHPKAAVAVDHSDFAVQGQCPRDASSFSDVDEVATEWPSRGPG